MHSEPVRMAYVGCGFVAQHVHLPNFAAIEGCRLVALAEARPKLATLVAERYGIQKVYQSHLELAEDAEVEAVGVSAGFAQQGEIAADLLRAGKHVFMEKPMAVSIGQAERVLAAAREGNARLMVGYMKRYDPGNVLVHDTVAAWRRSGEMGPLLYARAHGFCGNWTAGLDTSRRITTDEPLEPPPYREQLPPWLPAERAGSYLSFLQQYTHNLNLLRYVLDAGDAVRVRAVDLDPDGVTGIVVLDMAGTRAVLESGSMAYHQWDEHTQVYFRKGWLHTWAPPFFVRPGQARVEVYEGGAAAAYRYPVIEPAGAWHYREEDAFFIQALRSGEPFRSSGDDTLTDVRLFEEVYRAYLDSIA